MSAMLATIGFLIAAWLSFVVLTSLSVSLTWNTLVRRLRAAHPRRRANVALAAALAPSVVPSMLLLACLAPGLATFLDHHADHCLAHADHPHLCLVHAVGTLEAHGALLLGITLAGLTIGLARAAGRVRKTRLWLARLGLPTPRDPAARLVELPSSRPISFVAGLLRPRIFLSSRLASALTPDQVEIVLAHERAHQARRDPLRRAVAEACSLALPPAIRRAILDELTLASEQVCDEEAADGPGNRLAVAETLLAVERLAQPAMPSALAALPAFGQSNIAARVHSLLAPPRADRAGRAGGAVAAVAILAGLWLSADPLHHLTEHWLRLIF